MADPATADAAPSGPMPTPAAQTPGRPGAGWPDEGQSGADGWPSLQSSPGDGSDASGAGPVVAPYSLSVPADDAQAAAATLAGIAARDEAALLLLFSSPGERLQAVVRVLGPALPAGCDLVACASAGEFHHRGYQQGHVVAVVFPRRHFRALPVRLGDVSRVPVTRWMDRLRTVAAGFAGAPGRGVFGLLLTSSPSGQEEVVMATLDAALPRMRIVGGTVGDIARPAAAGLSLNGETLHDEALLCLVETDLGVQDIAFAHFTPTLCRMVVTAVGASDRVILRLNDEPAVGEYARMIGVAPDALTPAVLARHPLLWRLGERDHVRAVVAARPDGGLELLAGVERGILLTLAEATDDLCGDFDAALSALPQPPLMVLGFDCVLRRLAVETSPHMAELARLFARYRVAGVNTTGEQHRGQHVNQTFVGMAFLPRDAAVAQAAE